MDRIALLIEDLAAAEYRPKAALREALKHPSAVAEATLPLLEGAADGRELTPEETNLLFWGCTSWPMPGIRAPWHRC